MGKKIKILKVVQKYVFNLFKNNEQQVLIYHKYSHTVDVVNAAEEIALGSGLSSEKMELLLIAAWFHDTGYLIQHDGHEEISAQNAKEFLLERNFPVEKIDIVVSAIMATKLPQNPKNLIEDILCDADFAHLGKKQYLESCQLLRLEKELLKIKLTDEDWLNTEIEFLSKHSYHSEYAQREFANGKARNILRLQKLLSERKLREEKEQARKKKEKDKFEIPDRGVETMFRVAFRNHINLSSIADSKANIMLSINAIIISISLTTLIPRIDFQPGLVYPTILLLIVCIVTIIFATLSTRPKISEGKFTRDDIAAHKPNLLFFGNFHGMPLDEFTWGMEELMKNRDYLYGSLIKDFYFLGVVLAKKYRYLRICYGIFMYGMILVVASFLLAFLLVK